MNDFEPLLILSLGFFTDIVAGDPPNRYHPVAWMGIGIDWYRRRMNSAGNVRRFQSGLLLMLMLIGTCVTAGIGLLVQRGCQECSLIVAVVLQAVVLMCTFSAGSLARAATAVADALDSDNVPRAREQVAFHLVSRDVSTLDASELSAATIESVAENSSDSIVAPLFYFAVAGLPGALLYRFVNTCDAMLGYRTSELEWFGKPAARLDDVLNLVPSRLTALMMLCSGRLLGTATGSRRAVTIWWRDHALTASPNAGHSMSAAAGVLGVKLENLGHYRLGAELPPPSALTIARAVKLLWATSGVAVLVFGIAVAVWGLA
jgi:adenosylcobinamide-phosphate synthase